MSVRDLVRMANQIAGNNEAYPEAEAVRGVEAHIRQFWDPRMRREMRYHLEAGGQGLTPLARAGAERACRETEGA
jgi:formate dehydrogenase subunit delta